MGSCRIMCLGGVPSYRLTESGIGKCWKDADVKPVRPRQGTLDAGIDSTTWCVRNGPSGENRLVLRYWGPAGGPEKCSRRGQVMLQAPRCHRVLQ
jgi:hypothetical protein